MTVETPYEPPGLRDLVDGIRYKMGWDFHLRHKYDDDGSGGLILQITSFTDNSLNPLEKVQIRHNFLVPPVPYNRDVWAEWLFERISDIETHEAAEFFEIDGFREFSPDHGPGENHYGIYHRRPVK